jgi:DNA repair protein RadC
MTKQEQQVIDKALMILERNLKKDKGLPFSSPETVKNFLRLELEAEEREIFLVMFLDNQHRLIESESLFLGTIAECSVYPREIAKRALSLNAAAVILSHNHPSGDCAPSQADIRITKEIRESLSLFKIRILDHIIIGQFESKSLAESGLI